MSQHWEIERNAASPFPQSNILAGVVALVFKLHPDIERFQLGLITNPPPIMLTVHTPGFVLPNQTKRQISNHFIENCPQLILIKFDSRIAVDALAGSKPT